MKQLGALLTAAAAAVTLVLTLAVTTAPAQAATVRTFQDSRNDTKSTQNIYSVRVANGWRVGVTTKLDDLRSGGIQVYLDTTTRHAGPEYLLTSGIHTEGTDWQVLRMRSNWRSGRMLNCFSRVSWSWDRDTVNTTFGRACLGKTKRVRVAVRVSDGSRWTDWAPGGRRQFSPWVPRG